MMDYCSKAVLMHQEGGEKTNRKFNKEFLKSCLKRALYITCISGLSLGSIYFSYPAYISIKETVSFKPSRIEVLGTKNVPSETILSSTSIDTNLNTLGLKLQEIKSRIFKNPFVKDVEIIRSLPDTIKIKIIERDPRAILEDGRLWYLDEAGESFKEVEADKGEKLDYPVLTGVPEDSAKDGSYRSAVLKQSLGILKNLEGLKIYENENISEINFCEIYGFSVYFGRRPVRVILGFEDMEKKIQRLKVVVSKFRDNLSLLSLIDLDYRNKAVVRLRNAI